MLSSALTLSGNGLTEATSKAGVWANRAQAAIGMEMDRVRIDGGSYFAGAMRIFTSRFPEIAKSSVSGS